MLRVIMVYYINSDSAKESELRLGSVFIIRNSFVSKICRGTSHEDPHLFKYNAGVLSITSPATRY